MEQPDNWSTAIQIGGLLGTIVTAIATFFLWRVTKLLAIETERMAKATAQPHIVATLDPNRWSMRHFDINVSNTGNATAYDIHISFDPPLENGEARTGVQEIPLRKISVLKPGQGMSSYLCEFNLLQEKRFTVTISWKQLAGAPAREENTYDFDMADHDGISRLGDDPVVEIATHLKHLDESLSPLARGQRRLQVDSYSTTDRLHARRVNERQRRKWEKMQEPTSAEPARQ